MKEKLEIQKKQKIGYFRNNVVEEIINVRKNTVMFRLYENDALSISYLENSEDDDYGFYLAEKNQKHPYFNANTLNIQRNIIANVERISDKKLFDLLQEIGEKISHLSDEVVIKYYHTDVRHTLTNLKKLHINSENAKNVFEVEYKGDIFTFEYRKIVVDNIVNDISRLIKLEKQKAVPKKYTKLIIPTNLNAIYDFFEVFLSCENVIGKDLINKKIFSNKLSLYTSLDFDDTKSEKYGILPFFDWEGSINVYCKSLLIENGIIQKPYADKTLAAKYQVENTACSYGVRDEFPCCVLLGAYINPSNETLKELAGDGAVYIEQADISLKGDVVFINTKKAYLYEDGNLSEKVENFEVEINAYELFRDNFLGVSKDFIFGSDTKRGIVFDIK